MDINDIYMDRCLQLARCGLGAVAPNPMVGAVVVCDGRIVGEGFHRRYGEAHAEVNAIRSVRDKSLLHRSTLYVSLEPCSHQGKTPPCCDLILRSGIPRVVVACLDPFPEVAGNGVGKLCEAGVDVLVGVKEQEALALNRFFMTAQSLHRPYIILKWAQSGDGFIDRLRGDASEPPVRFSGEAALRMVHRLRAEVQSVMVGTNTAILDNPALTVRHWVGYNPLRLLMDRNLRVSPSSNLLDGTASTVVFTTQQAMDRNFVASRPHVEYVPLENSGDGLENIMAFLYGRGIHSLLVEGGAQLHRSFLEKKLWDEVLVETAPFCLGKGVKAADITFHLVGESIDKEGILLECDMGRTASILERFVRKTF